MRRAGLYAGPGTSAASVLWKQRFLREHGWETVKIEPDDLSRLAGIAGFDLIVMPGGEAEAYETALGPAGYDTLLGFGGTVWGACAGAFYLSATSSWNPGKLDALYRQRERAAFGGNATGPYHTGQMSASGTTVQLRWADGETSYARCFRGPVFDGFGDTDIPLVTYANRNDACGAVLCRSPGGGRVILTGFHPEMDWMTGLEDMLAFWKPKPDGWDEGVRRTRQRFMALLDA